MKKCFLSIRRIVDEGHTLGMHSYSNQYSLIYQSEDAFEAGLYDIEEFFETDHRSE